MRTETWPVTQRAAALLRSALVWDNVFPINLPGEVESRQFVGHPAALSRRRRRCRVHHARRRQSQCQSGHFALCVGEAAVARTRGTHGVGAPALGHRVGPRHESPRGHPALRGHTLFRTGSLRDRTVLRPWSSSDTPCLQQAKFRRRQAAPTRRMAASPRTAAAWSPRCSASACCST